MARIAKELGEGHATIEREIKAHWRMVATSLTSSEFTDLMRIETDPETRKIQYRVFYCVPMNSNQKSNCKRNHELIRYVIPKNRQKSSRAKKRSGK